MNIPRPFEAILLGPEGYARARSILAQILTAVRAHKRHRPVPPPIEQMLIAMTPQLYLWHWFAWRLGGFRRGRELGTTEDGKVVVIHDGEIQYGDPLTEEVVTLTTTESAPAPLLTVEPNSKYKVH